MPDWLVMAGVPRRAESRDARPEGPTMARSGRDVNATRQEMMFGAIEVQVWLVMARDLRLPDRGSLNTVAARMPRSN